MEVRENLLNALLVSGCEQKVFRLRMYFSWTSGR